MFTIKQAATRVGVEPATLRAWEQRYGVVSPRRSPGGYRVYDDHDLGVLRTMAGLIQDGWSAAQAAEQATKLDTERTSSSPVGPPAALDLSPEVLVTCAASFDAALLSRALDDAFGRASFERVITEWLLPGLEAVGRAWTKGEVSIAGEHFVTAAVQRRLAMAYEAAGNPPVGPVVLIGLPAESRHELGVLTFATLMRRQGVRTRYAGTDLPAEAWVSVVTQTGPAAVVMAAPMDSDVPAVRQTVESLRAEHPELQIFVGGGCQDRVPDVERLGHDILEAADYLRARLQETPVPVPVSD